MQIIKFSSIIPKEHQFVLELRKKVNNYFKQNNISPKANYKMIIKTIILLCSYLVPFIILLLLKMPVIVSTGLTVLMGIGIAGIGMGVMHDACHGAYSKKHWVNSLLGGSLYLLGSNVLNWKIQHNVLHHTYTNISGFDEDIDDKGPIRLSENKPLKWYHKYQVIYAFLFYGLMTITMLTNDFTRLYKYHKEGLLRSQNKKISKEFSKMLLRKLIYLTIIIGLPLWLTDYYIWQILLGFFIMHWTASIILSFVFQMAHVVEGATQPLPEPNMHVEWSVHQLNTTADFARNNKLLSWYVGGLNFQIEHHLFPNICHIHYKKIAPIVEETAKEFGLQYNIKPTFRNALLSHIYRLKELGKA
ncbi:MAG: acyl-CoA desaturase [Bacteroidetes bacterium]|nr:acyl-CoA desaturase [Bacteroidota bacterium]